MQVKEVLDILLLEDNDGDAALVRTFLPGHLDKEYNLRIASNMADCKKLIASKRPDILLLDLNLPDSNKDETLDFVQRNKRKFAIVVMSGHDVPEIRMKAIKSGAEDFLVKGEFDGGLLGRVVNYSVERHLLHRKLRNYARKLNDQRLKLVEAQALAGLGNWELDAFNLQFTWGPQAVKILELAHNQTQLVDFLETVVEEDRKQLREVFRQAIEDNSEFNIDISMVAPEGEQKYLNLRVRSNHAKVLEKKVIVGTIQDITGRKMIEDDLKQSEEKYHNLFEESRDAIYITTREGAFIEFNKATTELFGYDKLELRLLNVKDLYLNPFERVKFAKEIEEKGFVRDFEVKLRKKNGSKIDCVITSTLWHSNDGKQQGYQGVIRDITERRQALELIKEKEVAERSTKLKERFLANMSHEIRTPINAISGLSHLLLQSQLEPKQQEYISGIRSSSQHLLELVNDILDFSKIEAGKIHFESIPFNIHMVLGQILSTLRFRATEKKLDLQLEIDPEVPYTLKGDPLRLKQILINLIGNSIKFTDQGHIKLSVKVIESSNQDYVLSFSVEDTGIGIPDDKLDSIFSSFTQLGYDVSKPEGTGLGLTITKQLVELQGGTITLKSKVGEGTVFKVVLKYRKEDVQGAEQPKVDAFNFPIEDIGYKRILIVEDKKLNQLVAKEMLLKWWSKLEIDVADNGKIAIDKINRQDYDIILMDVQMPEMDGYEATRYIRSRFSPPTSKVPILAMTAYATTSEVDKCLEAGMNDFISKPFEPRQLYNKIMSLIHNQGGGVVLPTKPTEDAAPQASFEQLDLSYLNQISGGNEDLRKQIIGLLLEETPDELEKLSGFTRDHDWPRVRGVAHKMKSSATYMGMKATLANLKTIEENAAQNTNTEKIPGLVAEVRKNFSNALETLRAE